MGVFCAMTGDWGYAQLEYHDIQLRIKTASWEISGGLPVYVRIWDSGQLVHSDTYSGSGSVNVPGNYQLIWETDPLLGDDFLRLPAGIEFDFRWLSA
jgi:hypothetical protein